MGLFMKNAVDVKVEEETANNAIEISPEDLGRRISFKKRIYSDGLDIFDGILIEYLGDRLDSKIIYREKEPYKVFIPKLRNTRIICSDDILSKGDFIK